LLGGAAVRNTALINVADRAECVKDLTEQLEKMPFDVLKYISGAVDLAGMLDAADDKTQAS